jgi:hypothetical protein
MVGSGDTGSVGVSPTDSRRDRTPFCTLQATSDQVDVNQAVVRDSHPGTGILPAGRAGYRKSYIAAEPTR